MKVTLMDKSMYDLQAVEDYEVDLDMAERHIDEIKKYMKAAAVNKKALLQMMEECKEAMGLIMGSSSAASSSLTRNAQTLD